MSENLRKPELIVIAGPMGRVGIISPLRIARLSLRLLTAFMFMIIPLTEKMQNYNFV